MAGVRDVDAQKPLSRELLSYSQDSERNRRSSDQQFASAPPYTHDSVSLRRSGSDGVGGRHRAASVLSTCRRIDVVPVLVAFSGVNSGVHMMPTAPDRRFHASPGRTARRGSTPGDARPGAGRENASIMSCCTRYVSRRKS